MQMHTTILPKPDADPTHPLRLHFCSALIKPLWSKALQSGSLTCVVVSTVLSIKYPILADVE